METDGHLEVKVSYAVDNNADGMTASDPSSSMVSCRSTHSIRWKLCHIQIEKKSSACQTLTANVLRLPRPSRLF